MNKPGVRVLFRKFIHHVNDVQTHQPDTQDPLLLHVLHSVRVRVCVCSLIRGPWTGDER